MSNIPACGSDSPLPATKALGFFLACLGDNMVLKNMQKGYRQFSKPYLLSTKPKTSQCKTFEVQLCAANKSLRNCFTITVVNTSFVIPQGQSEKLI